MVGCANRSDSVMEVRSECDFDGKLASFVMYDRPLSGEEVGEILQAASPDSAAIVAAAVKEGIASPDGQPLEGNSSPSGLPPYAKVRFQSEGLGAARDSTCHFRICCNLTSCLHASQPKLSLNLHLVQK